MSAHVQGLTVDAETCSVCRSASLPQWAATVTIGGATITFCMDCLNKMPATCEVHARQFVEAAMTTMTATTEQRGN